MNSIPVLIGPCALGPLLLLMPALLVRGQSFDASLTPVDRQMLEAWEQRVDAFPTPNLKKFLTEKPFRQQLDEDLRRAASGVQEKPTLTIPPETARFNDLLRRAKAGDAKAQVQVAEMLDEGKGVAQNYAEAAAWWLKAADQGLRVAQHNLGVAYVAGLGVPRDAAEAVKWLSKAAEQGDSAAELYAGRLEQGLGAAPPVVLGAVGSRRAEDVAVAENNPEAQNQKVLADILSDFHKNHTYLGSGICECVDMANDVWNLVRTKGFPAKIRIGNVDQDIADLADADHAWVMAEASPGKWLALEPTAGIIVRPYQNYRHYNDRNTHDFTNAGDLKEYQNLIIEYTHTVDKYNEAAQDYNQAADEFNNSTGYGQQQLKPELDVKLAIKNMRKADLDRIRKKLTELLYKK